MMEKVSVIITTYKRPDTLRRAILSVLGQSYINIELIIVNDNGTDSPDNLVTRRILEWFLARYNNVKYIEHEKNLNGAAARNSGIKEATGRYITFLDDDDVFLPTRIEQLVKTFSEEQNLTCIYTGVGFIQGDDVVGILHPAVYSDYVYQLLLQNSFFGTGSNFICKTDLVREIGGFDESFTRHQDIEFLIRYLSSYPEIRGIEPVSVIKNLDSKVNFPETSNFHHVKSIFLAKFADVISDYTAEQQKKIWDTNARQIVTVAAMNKDFFPSGLSFSPRKKLISNYVALVKNIGKWSILQIPGLKLFRSRLAIIRTKHRYPEIVMMIKNYSISIETQY